MLNDVHASHADLFRRVGGSIGMRISLVKKKLPVLSLCKEEKREGAK